MNKVLQFILQIYQRIKQKILSIFSPKQIVGIKLFFQKLVSKQPRLIIHLGVIFIALGLAGFNLANYFQEEVIVADQSSSILAHLVFPEDELETVKRDFNNGDKSDRYLSLISVASAAFIPGSITTDQGTLTTNDPSTSLKEEEKDRKDLVVMKENTLVKSSPTETQVSIKPREEIIKYTVREGDTIFSIAKKFGIDGATILKENKLYADDIIKPGMKLTIPPVSGTTERVDPGESLSEIARKHEADINKIMKFNKLVNADDIEVGQILIIPDGKREIKARPRPSVKPTILAAASPSRRIASRSASRRTVYRSRRTVHRQSSSSNRFPWGYCTWYVASRRGDITWRGNAGTWLAQARAQGRATGRVPAVGAIMVTSESWWGHVAIVEAVHGDQVTISEMNYRGFGVVSTRTISNRSGFIKGYIY